ncbi:hypothetical protein FHX15_006062 [Rhizobium sp. BK650]|uniref:hypothetical protein n=1 Tax=Rhizobium sp. BK650 TaxID=2586990 RepID=UPI001613D54A|nr:hypothetical protein [Rhizobium sp. BK650]MBB3660791.1 hypothetical protein [Rhizobium sp. BK650]
MAAKDLAACALVGGALVILQERFDVGGFAISPLHQQMLKNPTGQRWWEQTDMLSVETSGSRG